MNAEINNELDDSTSTNSAGVTLFIRELVIDPDKGPITIEDTPTSILSSSSGSSSLLVDDNNNNNPNNNNNNNKTSTSCSSASTSESSACSINYLPIPKSSSGHSNASSSSTTSSSSSSSSTRSSSSKSSSSSSSSSKTSSNRRRKHRIKNKESSNTKQQQQVQNQLPAAKNIFILNAFVNGFVQLKLCADKIDYAYIVEIYWSNDTRSYVKRTYDDFVDFNKRFLSEFVESAESSDTKTNSASTPSKSGSRSPLSWSPNTRKKFNGSNTLTATTKTNEFKKDVKFFNFATNSHVILPTLPVTKKRFWISQLKLAESREIQLNEYVQHLLKLPTNISHNPIVVKFFETQSSDPKPVAGFNLNSSSSLITETFDEEEVECVECDEEEANETDEVNSNSLNNSHHYADEADLTRCQRISSCSNHNSSSDDEENEEEVDEDEDDEDEDFQRSGHNHHHHHHVIAGTSTSSMLVVRKKSSKESSLWWDEDSALNELSTSMSVEFGSQFNLSATAAAVSVAQTNNIKMNKDNNINNTNEEDEDELKTIDNLINSSELFNETFVNTVTAISS